MAVVSYIYPIDLYRAAALNAYIARGFAYEDAVPLAIDAADKMNREVNPPSDEFEYD